MSKTIELGIKLSMLMSGNYNAGLTKASKLIGELTRKTQGLQKQSQLIKNYRTSSAALTSTVQKLNENQWQDSALLKQYQKQESTVAKYRQQLQAAGIDVTKLDSYERSLGYTLDSQSSKLERLKIAQAKYNSIREQLFNWGNIKMDFITSAGLVKAFSQPMKAAADFESAMARVRAAGFSKRDADMSGFEELRKQAIQLGRDTQYTAVQAAQTQENLIRGGMTWKQTLAAMPSIMAMAAAEGMDLAQSANMVVGVLSAMEIPAEMSQRVSDILANMSVSAKANIATIYETVSKAAPMAHIHHMPLEHVAAMAAAAQQRGIDASTAGTAISTGLIRLSDAKIQGKLSKMGITVKDSTGMLRQIDDLLSDIYSKINKLGSTQQADFLGNIFGKHSVKTWTQLVNSAGSGDLQKYINSNYTEADGLSLRMQNINLDTYNGQISLLTSAWAGLQQKIGDAIEPINRYVVQTLTRGINAVTEFMNKHEGLADVLIKIAYAAAGLKIFMTVYKYAKLTVGLVSSYLELQAALGGVSIFTKLAAGAQWLWNAALNANPIGLIVTGVAGLIAVGTLLYQNWESVRALGTTMWGMIQSAVQSFNAWWESWSLKDIFSGIYESAVSVIESVKQPFIDLYNWIKNLFSNLNPFNWSVPVPKMSTDQQVKNADAALNSWGIPDMKKRALGGLITRPEIALIGEAGPEAVIPLSPGKKTRGLQMLNTAASSLGVNIMTPEMQNITNQGISNTMQNVTGSSDLMTQSENLIVNNNNNRNYESESSSRINNMNPAINITVNASGSEMTQDNGNSIANNIYDRVKEALSELMNNESRLSYA